MEFVYNVGGRIEAGYKGIAGDCATRAIAIVTGIPYKEVYDSINKLGKTERITKTKTSKSTARNGVYKSTYDKYIKLLGYTWIPTMFIGSGCKFHLKPDELPSGRLIVCVSKHITAVIDGVIYDTYDCSREGKRCVYGYYVNNVVYSI